MQMQVNEINGQWICCFCGHRNDASGALAVQGLEARRLPLCDNPVLLTRAFTNKQLSTVFACGVSDLTRRHVALQTCQELHIEAVDYLERDPRLGQRLPEQQPPMVLAVDVTSDAIDLDQLKASLSQVCC